MSNDFRLWALVSKQGTAMHDTVLCDAEVTCPRLTAAVYRIARKAKDWSGNKRFIEVSDNDALNGSIVY